MSRASALFRLQEIDSELSVYLARVQSIGQELGDNPSVRAAQRLVLEVQTELHTTRVDLRSIEHDTQALDEKVVEVEKRLYGGAVTHPKELQDLQHDLDSLKRRRAEMEEKQLDALIGLEAGESRLATLQANLARNEGEAAKTDAHLTREREKLQVQIDRLQGEREAVLASIPADDRQLYDRLRQTKSGRAVTRLEDGVCSACGVAPSSSRLQSVRQGGELIRCGNCERILYAE